MAVAKSVKYALWVFGDAHSEVEPITPVNLRNSVHKRKGAPTSKEGLHLDALNPAGIAVADDKPVDIDNALAVDEKLDLAISLASIVQEDTLRHSSPTASLEGECTTSHGVTVRGVAGGERRNMALLLICTELGYVERREIRVHLSQGI